MTGEITAQNGGTPQDASTPDGQLRFDTPVVDDGPALHRITRDSGVLDVNSPYAYLLWCRDFAQTSVVARADTEVVGFVTGFIRPDAPDTVVVWQVAVDSSQRGRGVASKLLAHLLDRMIPRGVRYLETTITADNDASIKLFTAAARDRGTEIVRSELFAAELFPDAHLGEDLYRVGPFAEAAARA
ncbi:diaminobutyrate acetyltransferase [Allosaccharopolyspora coralli]|uniref:L-2,4-diaminobutyric acid acetyltransferase n=1 Tax=Allosaccharopolyspora coralli TaxID=2665642 RepID=A0A5Q3QA63_9PSEU|nr:diaminobutyrate acetyltransferase [Allosaccharopolyspora coralli]QGK68499.1 diaminobutyrate acetyltransferase [Allosaccharopolyspora coralli]